MGKASREKKQRHDTTVTEQKERASKTNLWYVVAIVGVIVVGGLLAFLAFSGKSDTDDTAVVPPAGTEVIDSAELARNHVSNPSYDHPVPAGEDHIEIWQNCGVYREPQETGNIVHALEHGAVWVAYSPDLSEADRDTVEDLADRDPFTVIAPNPDVGPGEVWASAWGYRLQAAGPDDARLAEFVDTFARGPQTPEPGSSCSGGVGSPI